MRRGVLFSFIFLFLTIFLTVIVYAQNETDVLLEIESEYPGAELEADAGIGPDNFFYFIDKFFDRFGDELKVREEKIAEIKEMIREGKYEEAREALERYLNLAEKLENEIDPEKREEARRSAAAIRNTLEELEDEIPEDLKQEFVDGVKEREVSILTAAEIASKIKELCEQLSELDPLEYSRVCKTDDDFPDWHKKLDKELTEEQKKEMENFARIMRECFETSGQQCQCEEIPFKDFAETCSIAAPLAVQCEIEGNEEACEELDNLEMPELPPHLQEVFDRLEGDIMEAQFELHMPKECVEAGATTPEECMKIMIQTHAPEECRDALIEADVQNEREAREICEEILFNLHAPEECIEAGITDPKECGILMFQMHAPEECIEAGLTGEHRSDEEKCREIIEEFGDGEREDFHGFGANCREIENPEERLKCYDEAASGIQEDFEGSEGEPSEEDTGSEEVCTEIYDPVCGVDGITYSNSCFAGLEDVEIVCEGECPCEPESGNETTTEENETDNTDGGTTGTGAIILSNEFFNYHFN